MAIRHTLLGSLLLVGLGLVPHPSAAQVAPHADDKARTDAFGDLLPPGVLARMGTGRLRHTGSVFSVVFTASGKLASSGTDGVVLWDSASGKKLLRFEKGGGKGLAVSRDEKLLVVGGDAVYVWEVSTGKRLHRLQGTTALNYSVALSPDGTRVASADGDDVFRLRLWDTASGKMLRTLSTDKTFIPQLAFSPNGKILAAAHGGTVWFWDSATGKQLGELRGHTDIIYGLAFSPDGATIASGSVDRTIRLWNVATGKLIRSLKGHTHQVLSVVFSPDGKKLASAGGDDSVRIWDVAAGKELLIIPQGSPGSNNVNCVAFSPDGATLAAGSEARTRIRIWDAATGKEKQPAPGHEAQVFSVAFTPDGKRLLSGCFAGTVIGWSAATGKEERTYARAAGSVLALSPDGKILAVGSGNSARAWKMATGERILETREPAARLAFLSPARLLAGDGWSKATVWDLTTGKAVGEAPPNFLTTTPGGDLIYQKDNSLFLHDPATRKDRVTFSLPVPRPPKREDLKGKFLSTLVVVNAATVSRNGAVLATASQAVVHDNTIGFGSVSFAFAENIHIWELATGKLLRTVPLPVLGWQVRDRIEYLAFSPDGRTLAGGNTSHGHPGAQVGVWFWNLASGKQVHEIPIRGSGGEFISACVAFSPDGKTVATGGPDTTVLIWPLPPAVATRDKYR